MRFVAEPLDGDWDLVVNNHSDVDGMLSVFSLVNPELALEHRRTIVRAAEIGDFWCWGERHAQILFQGITLLMCQLQADGLSAQSIYEQCFDRIHSLLVEGVKAGDPLLSGIQVLDRSLELIESNEVYRHLHHERFVHYHVPRTIFESNPSSTLHAPPFNAFFSADCLVWPQARNRWDKERIQLVSVEGEQGTFYDLWYPGYVWADTSNSWRPPGLSFSGSTNGYYTGHQPLSDVVNELNENETGNGRWVFAEKVSLFETIPGRRFPVLLAFMNDENKPAQSELSVEEVASRLANAFLGT
jgi:hypothetical protein